jgi:hypothetical protein
LGGLRRCIYGSYEWLANGLIEVPQVVSKRGEVATASA